MSTTNNIALSANDVFQKIMSSKGNFVKVRYRSNPKPKAEFKNFKLEKITTTVIQAGVEFQNLKVVKGKIAAGERSPEISELPWGQWLVTENKDFYPYLIEYKNTIYLRLTTSQTGNHKPSSIYYVNDVEVPKIKFSEYLTPSDAKKMNEPSEAPPVYNIKLENLLDLPEEVL